MPFVNVARNGCFIPPLLVSVSITNRDKRGALLKEPVGTGPVQPVPDGTGPAQYLNRSGSHPQTAPTN
jgi:hypothetical protein